MNVKLFYYLSLCGFSKDASYQLLKKDCSYYKHLCDYFKQQYLISDMTLNIVAKVQDYRIMLEYNLREREKFDSENSHQNLTTRYFMQPTSSFDRGFYLNVKRSHELPIRDFVSH